MPAEPTTEGRAALAEWAELSESLLRGLVHALNNRLTALAAFAELAAMGDAEFMSGTALPSELRRLQEVGALFRLLASENESAEALELAPVLEDALALHRHHSGLRVVRCDVIHEGAALPVRVPRWALLRLLITVLETGKRSAERIGQEVMVLRVISDERSIVLEVDGDASPYTIAMAHRCGATVEDRLGRQGVRLPNLLEVRRVERERREGRAP